MKIRIIWGVLLGAVAIAGWSSKPPTTTAAESGRDPKAPGRAAAAAKPSDLEVHYLGLTPDGAVVYQVVNKGSAGTEGPFMIDLYLNGVLRDSIRHEPLPAMTVQTVQSNRLRLGDCSEGLVRVAIDGQKSLRESNRANNELTARLSRPCPKAP